MRYGLKWRGCTLLFLYSVLNHHQKVYFTFLFFFNLFCCSLFKWDCALIMLSISTFSYFASRIFVAANESIPQPLPSLSKVQKYYRGSAKNREFYVSPILWRISLPSISAFCVEDIFSSTADSFSFIEFRKDNIVQKYLSIRIFDSLLLFEIWLLYWVSLMAFVFDDSHNILTGYLGFCYFYWYFVAHDINCQIYFCFHHDIHY